MKREDSAYSNHRSAPAALAISRIGPGALFVSVFFENLSKRLYTPSGYAGLINYYIEKGQAPQALADARKSWNGC
jgi:hypothetical protein